MSILRKEYNLETHYDEVWYNSSNVIYSRYEEYDEDNSGDLYIVFKAGKQYLYEDVSYSDYLNFKHALTENSNGKALNEYIIKKYKGSKIQDEDLAELQKRLSSPKEEENTYFIHGSENFDTEIMMEYYIPTIEYLIELSNDSKFISTIYDKYAIESIKYMINLGTDPGIFTLYLMENDSLPDGLSGCKTVKVRNGDYENNFIDSWLIDHSIDDVAYITNEEREEIYKISKSAYRIIARRLK